MQPMKSIATCPEPPLTSDVLRRYDQPGPRYTSYPAAPHFKPDFSPTQLIQAAASCRTAVPPRGLSLYVHIPFCRSPCFFCGCNRVITRSADRGARYLERLLREIDLVAPLFRGQVVPQLHFGGGTPNFLPAAQIGRIVEHLRLHFEFAAQAEVSIEIDPRFAQDDDAATLVAYGFNRVSLGVQDFDPNVQLAVNRRQSREKILQVIDAYRRAGVQSINVDLMYGLPLQTPTTFAHTLAGIVEVRPTRLAVYGYAHMPALIKAQRSIRLQSLPDALTRVRLLGMAIATLKAAGYRYIGMDHFALPDDELCIAQQKGTLQRNFMGYTTHAGSDLLGFGVSAISHLCDTFTQNHRDLEAWEAAVDAGRPPVWRGLTLDRDDVIRAAVISEIMCHSKVSADSIGRRFGIDFWAYFSSTRASLETLQADGMLNFDGTGITVSPRGRYLLRLIAACFDRYVQPLQASAAQAPRFSTVI